MPGLVNILSCSNAEIDITAGYEGTIAIGTLAPSTVILGSTSSGSQTTIQSGSGGISINGGSGITSITGSNGTFITMDETQNVYTYDTVYIGNTSNPLTVYIGSTQTNSSIQLICDTNYSIYLTSSIRTAPPSSNVASSGFGPITIGTALQNSIGYNLLVNISVNVTVATSATITLGVGSSSTPTVNTVVNTFSVAATTIYNFSAIVPASYYLLVNTTGTITVGSITIQSCPM